MTSASREGKYNLGSRSLPCLTFHYFTDNGSDLLADEIFALSSSRDLYWLEIYILEEHLFCGRKSELSLKFSHCIFHWRFVLISLSSENCGCCGLYFFQSGFWSWQNNYVCICLLCLKNNWLCLWDIRILHWLIWLLRMLSFLAYGVFVFVVVLLLFCFERRRSAGHEKPLLWDY